MRSISIATEMPPAPQTLGSAELGATLGAYTTVVLLEGYRPEHGYRELEWALQSSARHLRALDARGPWLLVYAAAGGVAAADDEAEPVQLGELVRLMRKRHSETCAVMGVGAAALPFWDHWATSDAREGDQVSLVDALGDKLSCVLAVGGGELALAEATLAKERGVLLRYARAEPLLHIDGTAFGPLDAVFGEYDADAPPRTHHADGGYSSPRKR